MNQTPSTTKAVMYRVFVYRKPLYLHLKRTTLSKALKSTAQHQALCGLTRPVLFFALCMPELYLQQKAFVCNKHENSNVKR